MLGQKLGHYVDYMLEKPCVRSRGHIFSLIIRKLGQNVCLDNTLFEIKNGSCWVKNRSLGQILQKTLCTLWRPHFQFHNHETCQNICLDETSDELKMGYVGSKTWSECLSR